MTPSCSASQGKDMEPPCKRSHLAPCACTLFWCANSSLDIGCTAAKIEERKCRTSPGRWSPAWLMSACMAHWQLEMTCSGKSCCTSKEHVSAALGTGVSLHMFCISLEHVNATLGVVFMLCSRLESSACRHAGCTLRSQAQPGGGGGGPSASPHSLACHRHPKRLQAAQQRAGQCFQCGCPIIIKVIHQPQASWQAVRLAQIGATKRCFSSLP